MGDIEKEEERDDEEEKGDEGDAEEPTENKE
jgi:hypothetical protein